MPELVVDADGHTYEPDDLWVERMDATRWGDWIPRKVVEDEVYETYYLGGRVRGGGRELQDQMAAAVGMTPREFFDLCSVDVAHNLKPSISITRSGRPWFPRWTPGHGASDGACY